VQGIQYVVELGPHDGARHCKHRKDPGIEPGVAEGKEFRRSRVFHPVAREVCGIESVDQLFGDLHREESIRGERCV